MLHSCIVGDSVLLVWLRFLYVVVVDACNAPTAEFEVGNSWTIVDGGVRHSRCDRRR